MMNPSFESKAGIMTRRQFLGKSAVGLAGISAGGVLSQIAGCGSQNELTKTIKAGCKPNIVVILADDVGWNDVGYHGSVIRTPNIDRLGRLGVELDNFYVCPTCSPTRANLLTGRCASRFSILGPIGGRSRQVLSRSATTLPQLLRNAGYRTAITGKWHLGLRPEAGPRQYGFDYSYGYLHGQIDQYTHHYKNGDRSWHRNEKFIDETGHATDLITSEAVKLIRQFSHEQKPFFLYVPFSVPHYPLQEDDRWLSPYEKTIKNKSRRLFAASMTHMDRAVGELIKTLEDEKQMENTLVIFASDNGGQKDWTPGSGQYNLKHGPYDRLGDNMPLRNWKGSLYEGGIRVPAVMYWPGKLQKRKVADVIAIQDIMPTLAYLVGVETTADMNFDGRNITASLTANTGKRQKVLYWRTPYQLAVRKGDWKLIHNGPKPDEGTDELYNIRKDPLEKHNLAGKNKDKTLELQKELKKQFSLDS